MSFNIEELMKSTCLNKDYNKDGSNYEVFISKNEYRDLIREVAELRCKLEQEHKDCIHYWAEADKLKEKIKNLENEIEYYEDQLDAKNDYIKELNTQLAHFRAEFSDAAEVEE